MVLTRYRGQVLPPIGYRKDGSPIMPIMGGDGTEEPQGVELTAEAVDALADAVATKLTPKEPTVEEKPAETKGIDLDSLAAKIVDRMTPKRTEIEEPGVKSKPGEAVIYGGDDKFSAIGGTPNEVATNLFLVKTMCEATKGYVPSARLREVMVNAADKALKAGPTAIPAFEKNAYGGMKSVDPNRFLAQSYGEFFAEARAKAMTSTGANQGDEWVPTFATSELWRDVHLDTAVSASVPRVAMPTNPYTLPTLDADVTFYYASSENTAVTGSQPNTGSATLTASKIQADVTFSGEVTEDSIIPIAPTVRANLVRRGAQVMDDLIVHGDSETGATGNVNTDNGAPAAGAFYLALNGMRKFTVVTNTGQVSNVAAALTTTNFTTIRGLLGKYGGRPSDLRIVVGQSTLNTMYDIAQVKTLDTYGPNATILQGELARFFGIPILLSEATPVTDSDLVAADGKSDSTAGTLGWLLLFNVNGWKQGFRREFTIESDRNIQTDSNILVASFRMALIPSGISVKHTAYGRNITV